MTEFNNSAPKGRERRRALMDREAMEKMRLKQRRGKFFRYGEDGPAVGSAKQSSAMYMSEQERFQTDAAAEEKLRREEQAARKAAEILRRRELAGRREEQRWERMRAEKEAEEERGRALRADGRKARKNKGSMPYDMVTMRYQGGAAGERMRHEDQMMRYNAALRAQNLQRRTRGQTYDLITGKPTDLISLPTPPGALPSEFTK